MGEPWVLNTCCYCLHRFCLFCVSLSELSLAPAAHASESLLLCVSHVCVLFVVSSVSKAYRGWSLKRVSAMTRVFEKQELEAVAAKATEASPQDVLKRFYVPIVGTLRCKHIGPRIPRTSSCSIPISLSSGNSRLHTSRAPSSKPFVVPVVVIVVVVVGCSRMCLSDASTGASCLTREDHETSEQTHASSAQARQASEHTNEQTGSKDTRRHIHAVLEAHHATRALAQFPVVPFKLKRPLVVSFLHGKVERERLLAAMTSAAYVDTKIRVHAIAMSKPLDEPPAKVVLKRRHAAAMEAPVCARLFDTHSLVCTPNDAPDARWKFGVANGNLRRVADGKGNSKKGKSPKTKKPTISALAADVMPLDLPSDLSAYDCKPWRRVRDVTAQAHFVAEEMRAAADKDYVFDIKRLVAHGDVPLRLGFQRGALPGFDPLRGVDER